MGMEYLSYKLQIKLGFFPEQRTHDREFDSGQPFYLIISHCKTDRSASVLSLSLISSYTSIKQSRKCQWPILVQWVPEFYLPFLTLQKLLFNNVISCFCPLYLACSRSFSIGSVARSLIAVFCKTRDASLENILNDNKVVINLSSSWLSCFCLPLGD